MEKIEETKSINHEPSIFYCRQFISFSLLSSRPPSHRPPSCPSCPSCPSSYPCRPCRPYPCRRPPLVRDPSEGFFKKQNPQKLYIIIFTQGYIKIIME